VVVENELLAGGGAVEPGLAPRDDLGARGHTFSSTSEIGAATGIEFLGGGRVVAAAEPVRRGGGSALVESPLP